MHNTIVHHPESDARPELWSLPSPGQLSQLYTEYDNIWYQIFPWLVHLSYPGCVPFQLLVEINSILDKPRTSI